MESLTETRQQYAQDEERPLGSYLGTLAVYGGVVTGLALAARLSGRRLPRLALGDLALMTIATHRIARTIAKDPVTSPLRAPFTRFKGTSGPAELAEEVRGEGAKHTIGELLTCPFCTSQWVATGYVAGLVFAPEATRTVGLTMTAVAGSDWLQLIYSRLQP